MTMTEQKGTKKVSKQITLHLQNTESLHIRKKISAYFSFGRNLLITEPNLIV